MLYLDSSALVKHYIREAGTDALNSRLQAQAARNTRVFASTLGYAEVLATFARRLQEKLLTKREAMLLFEQFRNDWMFELTQVELTAAVLGFIPRLVASYPLRGADSVHLASALSLRDSARLRLRSATVSSLTFVASDKTLLAAASVEGLAVFDPASIS